MKSIISILILLSPFQLSAQIGSIDNKISKADSVILISHKITREFEVTPEGKSKSAPTFLLNKDVNPKIILSRKLLIDKQELIDLLHLGDGTYKHTSATCDEPRNSILIYFKGKLSYIDICFQCQRIHTSDDLKTLVFFDQRKYEKVEALFKS
ncbi:MAG: hypothetical protein WAR80_01355, partial [Ferruginibacter sp.]